MNRRSTAAVCGESVRNRCKFLQNVLNNPTLANADIFEACKSQSLLAGMSLASHGITALSRNSLYKYANIVITQDRIPNGCINEGCSGYRYLDWLRNEVKKMGKEGSFSRSKAARAHRVRQEIQELKAQVEELRKHSLALSKAYLHLFTNLKSLYSDESLVEATRQMVANMMNDHDRLYASLFHEVGTFRPSNLESL